MKDVVLRNSKNILRKRASMRYALVQKMVKRVIAIFPFIDVGK